MHARVRTRVESDNSLRVGKLTLWTSLLAPCEALSLASCREEVEADDQRSSSGDQVAEIGGRTVMASTAAEARVVSEALGSLATCESGREGEEQVG